MKRNDKKKMKNLEYLEEWVRNILSEKLSLSPSSEVFTKLLSIIAYKTRNKKSFNTLLNIVEGNKNKWEIKKEGLSIEDIIKRVILKEEEERFNEFNNKNGSKSEDRIYSLNHPVVCLGKLLFHKFEESKQVFIDKLLGRKGVKVNSHSLKIL